MDIRTAIKDAFHNLIINKIKTPLLDCELLISKAIKKNREYVILNLDKEIKKNEYSYFQELINQRSKGKPIAYLTGKKYFWKNEFNVSKDVLIPRPDTELIIEQVLNNYKYKNKINFLEIGVGSGCIMLSILKERKDFYAKGIDICHHSLKICKINAHKLGVSNRIKLFKSDIDNFDKGKYDLIISNPPYIKKLDLRYLDKDVINFEPKAALDGGLDGMSEIRKVVNKSSELIKRNGKLVLEIAFNQREMVRQLLLKKGFYINKVIKDLAKKDRCIVSTKK